MDPFTTVWRASGHGSHIYHSKRDCFYLKRGKNRMQSRLGSVLTHGYQPCQGCVPGVKRTGGTGFTGSPGNPKAARAAKMTRHGVVAE